MELQAYLLEWLSLLARWAHVVAGIAWIGASLYFIWLDDKLEGASDPRLAGELWLKWEAYSTWIAGLVLLVIVYYVNAELYLIDPEVMALSKPAAIGIGLGVLIVGYSIYEGVCRSPLSKNDGALALVLLALLAVAAWGLTRVFSGRGAFIHYGALLGTIMAANVAHIIIPGQRRMVQALREGRERNPRDALLARQRSVHNAYFTLPVVFTMIANHYAMTFGHRLAWLVLVAMTLAGALVRAWFVMRHKGRAPSWALLGALLLVVLTIFLVAPSRPEEKETEVGLELVKRIIDARCTTCHAAKPSFQGLADAPKGVKLDTEERIRAQAQQIQQQTVLARAMPPGNLTGMTEEERRVLDRWYRGGVNRWH